MAFTRKSVFTVPGGEEDIANYLATHPGVLGDNVLQSTIKWPFGSPEHAKVEEQKWREFNDQQRYEHEYKKWPPQGGTVAISPSEVELAELRKVTKHQAAIIEDLQRQLADLNRRVGEIAEQVKLSHPLHGRF